MSNNKQSSIEWLRQEWLKKDIDISIKDLFEHAKAMHKEEIMDAWIAEDNELQRMSAEQYYKETYENQ